MEALKDRRNNGVGIRLSSATFREGDHTQGSKHGYCKLHGTVAEKRKEGKNIRNKSILK